MRTDDRDFQDRAEHWAELQEAAAHRPVSPDDGAELEAAARAGMVCFDPLCGDPWPAAIEPRDIAAAALALDPIWRTLAVAAGLCLLALGVGVVLNG